MTKRRRNWLAAVTVILFIGVLLAGCWDYRELEKRAIIVGIGVDELPPATSKGKKMRMYQVLVQVVEPAGAGGNMGAGGSTQATSRKAYTNIVITTPSFSEGIERIVSLSDRIPNMAHLQLIGVGETLAKNGINELYDFLTRLPQMRRHTEIIVLDGPVSRFFTTPSISQPSPALHMAEMAANVQRTLVMPESNLGVVSKSVRGHIPFILVTASLDENKNINMKQAAVFDRQKMVGTLSTDQMQDLSLLQNEIERGLLSFPCSGGKKTGLQVLAGRSRIEPAMRNGRPHVTFKLSLQTELIEYQCLGASFDKQEQIRKAERLYGAELKKRLITTANKLKDKYKVDVFRLTTRLKNYPDLYKAIRNDPKTFMEQMVVDVNVKLRIRTIGSSLETPSLKVNP
ncbi:Ger(x)C family spore germination protein [Brevibacillus sp. NL20B1]|jgi:Ger(x)C family germination protein|uniref:Ger(x)C family spore germination protein n=1 Tax=Brevibacillus sp. NL20B1 TaxID=2829799 RepID=UPI001B9B74DD|nr:Ger(x)C family spore germination protein [Brevibacillus sp. NL20B1]MBR8661693.1 Ger(x)C family spore germination protein [Brevibacillus sp. NL20B1]